MHQGAFLRNFSPNPASGSRPASDFALGSLSGYSPGTVPAGRHTRFLDHAVAIPTLTTGTMALRASVQKAQVAAKPQRRVAAKAVRPVAALNAKAATAAAAVAVATVAACAPVGRLQQSTVRDSG
jgi:hypothetical protein